MLNAGDVDAGVITQPNASTKPKRLPGPSSVKSSIAVNHPGTNRDGRNNFIK